MNVDIILFIILKRIYNLLNSEQVPPPGDSASLVMPSFILISIILFFT